MPKCRMQLKLGPCWMHSRPEHTAMLHLDWLLLGLVAGLQTQLFHENHVSRDRRRQEPVHWLLHVQHTKCLFGYCAVKSMPFVV
jgi:hypothetical protein